MNTTDIINHNIYQYIASNEYNNTDLERKLQQLLADVSDDKRADLIKKILNVMQNKANTDSKEFILTLATELKSYASVSRDNMLIKELYLNSLEYMLDNPDNFKQLSEIFKQINEFANNDLNHRSAGDILLRFEQLLTEHNLQDYLPKIADSRILDIYKLLKNKLTTHQTDAGNLDIVPATVNLLESNSAMPTSLMTQQNSAELQVAVQSNNDMQVTLSDVQEIVAKSFLDRNIAVPISFGHLLSLLRIIAAASMQYNQILMSKMLEKIDLANQLQSFQNAMNDFASLLPLIISDSSIPWSDQKSDNMDTIFDYILNKYPSSPDCINFKNKISSILTKYGYDINSISKSGGNSVFTDAILRDVFGKLNSKLNKYNMNIPLQLPTDTINHAPTSKSDFQNYANQAKDLMDNVTSIENEDKSNVSSYQDIMRSMLGFLNDWYNSYSMLVRG